MYTLKRNIGSRSLQNRIDTADKVTRCTGAGGVWYILGRKSERTNSLGFGM